jgi:phosphomannomutase
MSHSSSARLDVSIYKPCDIRGDAATELSTALYERWGRALGRQLPPMAKFVVGGDVRDSTPPFLAALMEGLCRAGLDVVDLGLLPAPMIYYAKHRLRAEGCAIVTASHNSAAANGLRWMLRDRPPTPEDVAALEPSPLPTNLRSVPGEGQGEGDAEDRQPTAPRKLDVSFDYVACLQETFVESLTARQHVVVDPMHGCWAAKARRYLHAVFPQCLFSTIHDSVGDGVPECSGADALHELCEAVYRQRAHLGVAFDGDRLMLVDDEGVALDPEEAAYSLLQCLGEELRGDRFVCDVRFSDQIAEAARLLGAEPLRERSGRGFVRARMGDADALFGAEMSGHYYHRALEGGEDGLYTACRLIAFLARSGRTLAELRRGCPKVYMTPDLRLPVAADAQPAIIQRVRAAWEGFPQKMIDGVRIDIPGGWALVRSSTTEASLAFRFEGIDWHALDDLVRRFCDTLPECGAELWDRYRAVLGTDILTP